jgi:integrase
VTVPASLSNGKRYRPSFQDQESALKWLAEKNLEHAQGKVVSLTAKSGLGGILVSEVVELLQQEKKAKQDPEAFRILRNRLGKFVAKFGNRHAEEVTPWEVKRWLENLDLSQRTRFGVFSECRGLYRWAIRYRILKENPFDQMEPETKGRASKAILTPDQMREALKIEVPEYLCAWLVLGAFAGLRTAEILRLDWRSVDRRAKNIFIGEDVIKKTSGMRNRYVEILPALTRHLPTPKTGPVIPIGEKGFEAARQRLSEAMNWPRWPQNALRHSFASYHLAMWKDAGKTAHEMGHTSPQMIYSNYAEAVTLKAAREWWKL